MGVFSAIGSFIMTPLYYVISAILIGFHKFFSLFLSPEGGTAWALSIVGLPYVEAGALAGGSHLWIIRRHLVPAVAPVITVSVVLTASRAVLSESGLAFLGLGDPNGWSWGTILHNAQRSGTLGTAWWTAAMPSLAILLLVVAATLVSLAYNDARNPRTRED